MTPQNNKKVHFGELSIGTQIVIAITFYIVMSVLIFSIISTILEEPKRNAYWECHEEKNYSEWDACFDRCYEISYGKLSLTCNINDKEDCEIKSLKWDMQYEDYQSCARVCLIIEPEVKEVCEIQ